MNPTEYLGAFTYNGRLVEDGILDARSAARALNGIDSSLRFFISLERPDLTGTAIPIPVRVKQGSWEALIPTDIAGWITTAAGLAVSSYLANAAKKLAENDFKEKGLKDVVKSAIVSLQWLIRIGKHLGHLALRNLQNIRWDQEGMVGIINDAKEVLYVPIAIFKRLAACPKNLLSDLAAVVESERTLSVTLSSELGDVSVELTRKERYVFFDESVETEVLFPTLVHGMSVELEGVVTRGNEMSNTLGFLYDGHILTCSPRKGSIVRFKEHLFLTCKVSGEITREDRKGMVTENRPKIIIDDLVRIEGRDQMTFSLPEMDEEEEKP